MGDIEFVSELLIGTMHGPQGGSAKVLDDYYVQYEDFDDSFPEQKRATKLFRESLDFIASLIPDLSASRWSNKTDFYSLFVATASLLRSSKIKPKDAQANLGKALAKFGDQVTERLADEQASTSEEVVAYVRAVEKGANDKARRAARHQVLLKIMRPYFAI
jgi:hypothetical protein